MQQVRTPNLDPVIHDPSTGQVVTNWVGWCMGYVQACFLSNSRASAHLGWLACTNRHQDKTFPTDVYFLIWFDWFGTVNGKYDNWGHVAIAYIDSKSLAMTIWSSPLTPKTSADKFTSIANITNAFGGTIKYVGWSEDICGTIIIRKDNTVATSNKVTPLIADAFYLLAFNRHIDPSGAKVTVGGDIATQQDRIRKSQAYQDRLYKIDHFDTILAERNQLKAQQANSSEANLLGQALIKLLATFGYKKS